MRPLLIRVALPRFKTFLYYRIYQKRGRTRPELFRRASLHFAPQVQMNLSASDAGHGNIAFTGFYELELTRRIAGHARCGGLLVDVGANYGYFSLLWAGLNPGNRAFAFEASPRNAPAIAENIRLNHLESQVELRTVAVGRDSGKLPFTLGPEDQTGWGGLSHQTEDTVEVDVTRLDDVFSGRPIDVLKIDVEGADTWVLLGAQRLLQRKQVRHIYFEQNKPRMMELRISDAEAFEFLNEMGYQVEPLNDSSGAVVEYHASPKATDCPGHAQALRYERVHVQ